MIGSLFFLTWVPATENDRPDLGTVKEGRDTGPSEATSALRGLNLSPRRMASIGKDPLDALRLRMSAFGGKADVHELPSGCLLIAKSGHWALWF